MDNKDQIGEEIDVIQARIVRYSRIVEEKEAECEKCQKDITFMRGAIAAYESILDDLKEVNSNEN